MCLDTTVLVEGRKLREQDAGVLEDSKDSHWRQPLTSDSQAFVPEVTILHFLATHDQRSFPGCAPGLPGLYLAQLHLPPRG